MTTNQLPASAQLAIERGEPLPCESCHWRSILAQLGWFDASLLFVAPLNDEQSQLLNAAAEKYDLTGAELFEAVLRDALK